MYVVDYKMSELQRVNHLFCGYKMTLIKYKASGSSYFFV